LIRTYSAPTAINLEITEVCNFKCKHCYNPWRAESLGEVSLEKKKLTELLNEFKNAGVFHVIFSGGEPLAKFELLLHGIKTAVNLGLSTSINSTLSLATDKKMQKLKEAGADHILASWYDLDKRKTIEITGTKNSFEAIKKGIKCAVDNGIRVSVNTICTDQNYGALYESGKIVHSLGATQFIAHRVVPPAYDRKDERQHRINKIASLSGLDELLRLKKDTGIKVATLISYPLCLLGDLDKYADFVGRGCPTQSGHRFSINSNGDTHACVMEDKTYGNIFESGLRKCFSNSRNWRNKSMYFEGCSGCDYIDLCQTGCRMDAFAATGEMNGKDPLWVGKENITVDFKFIKDKEIIKRVENGLNLRVDKSIRWRLEKDFYLLNIRWANTIEVSLEEGDFLKSIQDKSISFSFYDQDIFSSERLALLLFKEAIYSNELTLEIDRKGVGVDPYKLPKRCQ